MDWNRMSANEKNAAYNNVADVGPDFAADKTRGWLEASTKLRAQHPRHLNLAYANYERTAWDFYPATDPNAPCYVFLHGGYWQRGSKEIYACMVQGVLARGWSAALPGYTLAPLAGLTQIVAELRRALDWFGDHAAEHGITGPLVLSGWSAGGHLTATLLGHPIVAAGLALSGVFDLAPLRDSPHVNDLLQLTDEEVATLSPVRIPSVDKPLCVAYGTAELPHMIASSRQFHTLRVAAGLHGDLVPIVDCNHFTILDELTTSDSLLVDTICRLGRSLKG